MTRTHLCLGLALLVTLVACGGAPTPTAPGNTLASATAAASSAPLGPEDQPLPLWAAVHKAVLPNGLTYYVMAHRKPEKRARLWLAVDAGSVQEDDDQRGLAHFVEHMAFNGTKRFPKQSIVNYLESLGMRFGSGLNAHTSWDQTVYELEVPTDGADFIPKGLDVLRDWAGAVTFDPTEIDKERGVVLEEWRLGRGADRRLFDKHAQVLLRGSRYADRIPIGLPKIIEDARPETVVRFYRDWYRPDLMAVVAVGDFEPADVEREIQARFGDLPRRKAPRTRLRGGVPVADGTRVSIETDPEATNTTVSISNLVARQPEASKRDYRRQLGLQLFAMVLQERLSILQRKPETPFRAASGAFQTLARDVDAFDRNAIVKGAEVEQTLRALLVEVARLERHGVSPTELDRVRAVLGRIIEQAAVTEATTDSRVFCSEITRNFFEHELMIGRAAEQALTDAMLPAITVAELNGLAKAFAGGANRVVTVSGPQGKPLPSRERVLAIVDEVARGPVEPWQDEPIAQALMAKLPAPGRIVKESRVEAVDVTDWTLSNGARVVVKPTDFELDSVALGAVSPGGEATVLDRDYVAAHYAAAAVQLGGVGDFDAVTLRKVLAGKRALAAVGIDETTEVLEAEGSVRDLETLLQLVHLRMTAPRKDPEAFAVWRANLVEQVTSSLRSPEVQFAREAQGALWQGNLRRRPTDPGELAQLDLDRALAIYRDRFGDASDFTFVIVGAVELAKLRPLVETYLASLPAKGRKEQERDLRIRKATGVAKRSWALGQEPKASVRLDFHGDEPWSRDKDRDMFILSQIVSIRLREVLREDLGGVYGIGVDGTLVRSPHAERSFTLRFGCDPGRVDELVKASFAELGSIAKDGVPADYLERVKQTFVRGRETELRKNRFWARWLATAYRYGDDPTIVLDTGKVVARMTSDHVRAAAKRYLDPRQYFRAVLLPEGAQAGAPR